MMDTGRHTLDQWATWQEVHAQPAIWRKWADDFDVAAWRKWVATLGVNEVWFCGAGTSAYIGDIIAAGLEQTRELKFRSVPSTDLVSRPADFLGGAPKLIVNFGRSGNSAESIGTLDALDALAPDWPRLNITCNKDGALATRTPSRVVLLPSECHDQGFAMTSSFSTMLLTALAIFDVDTDAADALRRLANAAESFLSSATAQIDDHVPERAVYVGAGPMAFAARESALKVMELTAGQCAALWDSTLGFRHGPKSFVIGATNVHLLMSDHAHAALYDKDLASELRAQFPDATITTIGPNADVDIQYPCVGAWNTVLAVLYAQLQGIIWSQAMGLNVDNPFDGQGTLTRVVADVPMHKPGPN